MIKNTRDLWKQFIPLSLSDVAMALGDPLHHGALAQVENPRQNLAAFGIGKSIAVFFEAPVIMILHASTALSGNPGSRSLFKKFAFLFAISFSLLLLAMASITPLYQWTSDHLFHLGELESQYTRYILFFMVPWPFIIGWRRFHQGVLIRYKLGRVVGKSSLYRVGYVALIMMIGVKLQLPGYILTGLGLVGGIALETILVLLAYYKREKSFDEVLDTEDKIKALPQNLPAIWKYYLPLSFSMVAVWGGRAALSAIISTANDSNLALAVWPVAWGIIVLLSNGTRMIQQIIIVNKDHYAWSDLRTFAISVGIVFTTPLILLCMPYVGESAMRFYMGTDPVLAQEVQNLMMLGLGFPMLTVFQNVYQGKLIAHGQTKWINIGSILGMGSMVGTTSILCAFNHSGAMSALTGMLTGLIIELAFLYNRSNKTN